MSSEYAAKYPLHELLSHQEHLERMKCDERNEIEDRIGKGVYDVNLPDDEGYTPLHCICMVHVTHENEWTIKHLICALLEAGANPLAVDNHGNRPPFNYCDHEPPVSNWAEVMPAETFNVVFPDRGYPL